MDWKRRKRGLRVIALITSMAIGAGCAPSGSHASGSVRRAGTHFGPVGSLHLLRFTSGPSSTKRSREAEDRRTAVHWSSRSWSRTAKVPDSKIRLDLGMELDVSPIDSSAISIEVTDQKVRLEGVVPSYRVRDRAELLARSITGVRKVDNGLTVESAREVSAAATPNGRQE